MALQPQVPFQSIKAVGTGGINVADDSSNIADIELADAENMVARDGFLAPREGSTLLYEKPSGETAEPLQLIIPHTSDGVEYTIAIYGASIYLRHPDTDVWIKINQTYVPTATTARYGYTNWNNGRGDDRLYLCNGIDNVMRWDMCASTAASAHTAGAATITLTDGTRFPASGGTLIIQGESSIFTEGYASRTGNVFTLSGNLSQNVASGASVVSDILNLDPADVPIGKHFAKYQQRLVTANYHGGETNIHVSVVNEPEDFTTGSLIADAVTETIADGNGEITALHDFGAFFVIQKEDSLHSFAFEISDDLGSKLTVIKPLVSGDSIGSISSAGTAKVLNSLYYPTRSNGFIQVSPTGSGTTVSTDIKILSQKITPLLKTISTDAIASAAGDNKIVWAVARYGATTNTILLEYDLERSHWVKHTDIAPVDLATKDGQFLYIESATGNVYHLFDGSYNDNNLPYYTSAHLKRFDFGNPAQPKSQSLVYIQGFMTSASEFYIDIFFDENGALGKQTFLINKDTEGLVFKDSVSETLGSFVLGQPMLGAVSLRNIPNLSVFRGYLAINPRFTYFTIQPRIYSNKEAYYGLSVIGHKPILEPVEPSAMVISPIES